MSAKAHPVPTLTAVIAAGVSSAPRSSPLTNKARNKARHEDGPRNALDRSNRDLSPVATIAILPGPFVNVPFNEKPSQLTRSVGQDTKYNDDYTPAHLRKARKEIHAPG
jgi:hypothetical protein